MPHKCLLLVLDGLGDRSCPELEGRTPLQAARTPVLDKIAAKGANGLFHPGSLGRPLPSEKAHFAMFGYDQSKFPGRGFLEALGAGLKVGSSDVCILAHLAALTRKDNLLYLEKDRPKVSPAEADFLVRQVRDFQEAGISVCFNQTHGLFGILVLSGEVLPFVTDCNPMIEGRPLSEILAWSAYRDHPRALKSAAVLKSYLVWAHERLQGLELNQERERKGLPRINGLLTQRAGQWKPVRSFPDKFGLQGLSIASGTVYHGLCFFLGMDKHKVKDTDQPGLDLVRRLQLAQASLQEYDFVHVHTKSPDEAAHGKDPLAKKRVIEMLDEGLGRVVEPLVNDPELLLVVTADHSTPSSGGMIHSGEPVPLTFCGPGVRLDQVRTFDEVSGAAGALSLVRGAELMDLILSGLDRAKLEGIMDTPDDQSFWPGNYRVFSLD
ncbi:MAG: 2,3-bisphosphoglycerate-independent phosphoglycerate mutase [Thermodesulfobacteriota bacterium]